MFLGAKHYRKLSLSKNKVTRVNDELLWRRRVSDLIKLEKQFDSESENNKIYKTRAAILRSKGE